MCRVGVVGLDKDRVKGLCVVCVTSISGEILTMISEDRARMNVSVDGSGMKNTRGLILFPKFSTPLIHSLIAQFKENT